MTPLKTAQECIVGIACTLKALEFDVGTQCIENRHSLCVGFNGRNVAPIVAVHMLSASELPVMGSSAIPTDATRGDLLDEVRAVSQQITERVRQTLGTSASASSEDWHHDWNRPLRVLCVDDNEDSADSLAAVLELLGCEARVCYDGQSALSIVPEHRPDVCFLDLSMPGLDGLELASRLRQRAGCRALLLVAVTAFGSLEYRIQTALKGFHFHLVKPADYASLRSLTERIRTMLRLPKLHHPGDELRGESNLDPSIENT